MLVRAGAGLELEDRFGATALMWAASRESLRPLRILLRAGAAVDHRSAAGTALHWALGWRRYQHLALLAAEGADLEVRDRDGWTVLSRAVRQRDQNMVEGLLQSGADGDVRSDLGWPPLAWASLAGDTETARALIHAGADVDVETPAAETALVLAARRGHLRNVAELIAGSATLDQRAEGVTALMWAAMNGHRPVVEELLRAGADPGLELLDGFDAAALAERFGHPDCATLLRDARNVGSRSRETSNGGLESRERS